LKEKDGTYSAARHLAQILSRHKRERRRKRNNGRGGETHLDGSVGWVYETCSSCGIVVVVVGVLTVCEVYKKNERRLYAQESYEVAQQQLYTIHTHTPPPIRFMHRRHPEP
jgi:hypothetical protein